MCIRDRASPFFVRPVRDADEDVVSRLADVAAIDRARRFDCLLYTSDAADERSSVDLGGRRIIKKKKNEDVHRRGRRSNIREEMNHMMSSV